MRRLTVALAVLTLGLAAAACEVASEVLIDVAEDGSGTVSVGVGTDVATATALGGESSAEGYESLLSLEDIGVAGWTYQGLTRESDNLYWLRASKPFGNSSELSSVLDEIVGEQVFTNFALERETSFARQEWTLTGEVTLGGVTQRVAGETALAEAGLLDLVEFIKGMERGATADDFAQALTFRLETKMPGSLSEGYQQGQLELDGVSDTSGEINVKTEAVNDTLIWIRTMAIAGSALLVVMLLIRVISKSAASRRRKVSARTLLKKAKEEEARERSAKKRKARARAKAATAAAELDQDEFESFASGAEEEAGDQTEDTEDDQVEDDDQKGDEAEPPTAEEAGDQTEDVEPPTAKEEADEAGDSGDTAEDAESATEEESDAAAELESPPDEEESPPDETDLQAAVTVAREPEAVNNQPASKHLQMLCVGLWGVLLNPPESLYDLLVPFVRKMDSGVDENLIRSAYREATLGQITPEVLWRNCGLDGQANWPVGGPESELVSINPGASELLQRVTEQGISVIAVGEAIGSWVREFLPKSGLDGLSSLMLTNEIGLSEDDPDFYNTLAAFTGIPPSGCLLIHARKQALDAAVKAGMSAAGYGEAADESAHPKLEKLTTLFGS